MKTIIVTGASQGIGKAIAARLLRDGYGVIGIARDPQKLAVVAEEFNTTNFTHHSFDIADQKAIADFVLRLQGQQIFAVVNNAGICKTARIDEVEETDPWDEVLATNLTGVKNLTQALIPLLHNSGRIINISSQLGKEGRAGYSAYCASKFGLIGLTKVWAKELGARNITVNAICPGWVETDMTDTDLGRLAEEAGTTLPLLRKSITDQLEMGTMNKPEDIAGMVAYLLSPDADRISGRDFLLQQVTN